MTIRTSLFAATALALTSTLHAGSFLRPYAAYVNPSAEGYSDAAAVGFAAGIQSGAQDQHEIGFDWSYTEYDSEVRIGAFVATGTEKYMPCLASYRFLFGTKENKARVYVGPSLGFTNIRASASVVGPGIAVSGSDSAWAATAAGSAGALVALTDKIALDVGYRFTRVGAAEVKVAGLRAEVGDVNVHSMYAGVSFRF